MKLLYLITLKDNTQYEKEISCITRQGAYNQLQQIENIKTAEEIKIIEIV